jgi:hypothetical protein
MVRIERPIIIEFVSSNELEVDYYRKLEQVIEL